MKRKYKPTGCARLLGFLLIFTPLVYFGVSYYQGENPINNIKTFLRIDNNHPNAIEESVETKSDLSADEKITLQEKIKDLEERIELLENTILELKSQ